jgi:hypothetical protein
MSIITDALAAEQARLAALPHEVIEGERLDDFYGGRLVLAECLGSGETAELLRSFGDRPPRFRCASCGLPLKEGGPAIKHSKPVSESDQVRKILHEVCALLGVDAYTDGVSDAVYNAERSRAETMDGKVAMALPALAAVLIRRDATAGSRQAMKELQTFQRERDDHPLFTEKGLYDLIGKDEARSVLARTRALARTMGMEGDL